VFHVKLFWPDCDNLLHSGFELDPRTRGTRAAPAKEIVQDQGDAVVARQQAAEPAEKLDECHGTR